jgi:hypothetical protein
MPSEMFLDVPEEPPSTKKQLWSDLESTQNKYKNRPHEVQENPEFWLQNAYCWCERKILFPAIHEGGRVLRILGLPQPSYQVG